MKDVSQENQSQTLEESIRTLSEKLRHNPKDVESLILRSKAFLRANELDKSLQDAELATKLSNGDSKAQFRRLVSLWRCGRRDEAKFVLRWCGTGAEVDTWNAIMANHISVKEVSKIPKETVEVNNNDSSHKSSNISGIRDSSNAMNPVDKEKLDNDKNTTIRSDWYQTATTAYVNVYRRGLDSNTPISIEPSKLCIKEIGWSQPINKIDPSKSKYTITPYKVEFTLAKSGNWKSLTEIESLEHVQNVKESKSEKKRTTQPETATVRTDYSKWDNIGDSDEESGDPMDFFKKIYGSADENTKRAMMKSFTESNGTALSTDWSQVSKGKVGTQPPKDMRAEKCFGISYFRSLQSSSMHDSVIVISTPLQCCNGSIKVPLLQFPGVVRTLDRNYFRYIHDMERNFEDEKEWPQTNEFPKAEPDFNDEDNDEEDSYDLDTSQQHQRVMLVRLPEYIMNCLKSHPSELNGAELGQVFMSANDPSHLKIKLSGKQQAMAKLPQNYNLIVTNQQVSNIFVLKEKAKQRRDRSLKKNALIGHAVNECIMTADPDDPNYNYVLQQRKLMELPHADRQTTLLDNTAGVGGAKYGATLKQQKESWRKSVQQRQLVRNASEGKAIRVPRNELLDMLFRSFEAQPYWTVKQLRERTRQPEMYLRSVLDSIAVLIKRGPYAMRYGLKEEYKQLQSSGATVENLIEQAPQGPEFEEDEDAEKDGDSDMEMENVEV